MKSTIALAFAAAVVALPMSSFACDSCGHRNAVHYTASYCAPACAPVCAPACPSPCFNPLSIVGGVFSGVGSAIGAIGCGISGAFGSCSPCY